MKTRHIFTSRNAFEGCKVEPEGGNAALLAEKMGAFFDQMLADCKRDSARLDALESKFRQPDVQARLGIKAGLKSGQGSEEDMAADNRRLARKLSNPVFASSFFLAQRTTFQARKRQFAGLPQRRLA